MNHKRQNGPEAQTTEIRHCSCIWSQHIYQRASEVLCAIKKSNILSQKGFEGTQPYTPSLQDHQHITPMNHTIRSAAYPNDHWYVKYAMKEAIASIKKHREKRSARDRMYAISGFKSAAIRYAISNAWAGLFPPVMSVMMQPSDSQPFSGLLNWNALISECKMVSYLL